MADPNLRDFRERLARIGRAHARGYRFEAAGGRGRSHDARPRKVRRPVMGPVLVIVAGIVLFKADLHQGLGAQDCAARAAALRQGSAFDRLGAVLMQPDPATLRLSARIGAMRRRSGGRPPARALRSRCAAGASHALCDRMGRRVARPSHAVV
jgi:hypothetical protein